MILPAIFLGLVFFYSLVARRLDRTVVTAPTLFISSGLGVILSAPELARGRGDLEPSFIDLAQAGAGGRDVGPGGFVLEQLGYGAAVVLSTVFISMFAHGLSAAPGIALYAARSSPTSPDRSEP